MLNKLKSPVRGAVLPMRSGLQSGALPVVLVLVSVELQRHWAEPIKWLYLLCVVLTVLVWIGVLTEQALAKRLANFAIDGVIFALLFAGLLLTANSYDVAGRELLGTLLFWAPAICAWWAVAYYAQPARVVIFTAMLYAGLLFPHRFEGERHVYEYLILGVLLSVLVRWVIMGLIKHFRFSGSEQLALDAAMRDPISGAVSRNSFEAELAHIAAVADRYREPFSLIACSIDGYGAYLERFGESASNELLRTFAWLVADRIRIADTLCRWEDAKFFVLLPSTVCADALKVAESIRQASTYISLASDAPATCCIGICQHRFGEDPMATFEVADAALQHALQAGKNQLAVVGEKGVSLV